MDSDLAPRFTAEELAPFCDPPPPVRRALGFFVGTLGLIAFALYATIHFASSVPFLLLTAWTITAMWWFVRRDDAKSRALAAHLDAASAALEARQWSVAAELASQTCSGPQTGDQLKRNALFILGVAQLKGGLVDQGVSTLELLREVLRQTEVSDSMLWDDCARVLAQVYASRGPAERARVLLAERGINLREPEHTAMRVRLLAREGAWEAVISEVRGLNAATAHKVSVHDGQVLYVLHLFAVAMLARPGLRQPSDETTTIPGSVGLPDQVDVSLCAHWPELREFLEHLGVKLTE